jgi:arylsulfatase A
MKTLERLKIAENTLVILCSDNGPVLDDGYKDQAVEKLGDHKPSGPYRGGKYSVYEGGTRTPFIASWKGKILPGVSDEMVCTIDIAASFAALTGTPIQENEFPDSFDVSEALLGKAGAKGRDHLIQQDNGSVGKFGYRAGQWKLVSLGSKTQKLELFDLSKDPSENTDVIKDNPEIAEQMKERLAKYIADGRSRGK